MKHDFFSLATLLNLQIQGVPHSMPDSLIHSWLCVNCKTSVIQQLKYYQKIKKFYNRICKIYQNILKMINYEYMNIILIFND